jgi:hypothetical protein
MEKYRLPPSTMVYAIMKPHELTEFEIRKAVELELQWLKYYAYGPSKVNLKRDVSLYDQLEGIGYAKKNIDLDKRCAFMRLTSDTPMSVDHGTSRIYKSELYRDNANNIYTALEYWVIRNPEDWDWVLEQLR